MIVLWIVIGVLLLAVLTTSVAVGLRRRRPPKASVSPPSSEATAPPGAVPKSPGDAKAERSGSAGTVVLEPPEVPRPTEPVAEEPAGPSEPFVVPPEPEPLAPPRFRDRLGKTRGLISGYLGSIRGRGSVDAAAWDELEEALIRADVGVATTTSMLEDLRARVSKRTIRDPEGLLQGLREELLTVLTTAPPASVSTNGGRSGGASVPAASGDGAAGSRTDERSGADGESAKAVNNFDRDLHLDGSSGRTNVWLFVGVNGVGKTTTVGKLARLQRAAGRSVLLAAGDTFRAAAGEQLAHWADRVGAEIVQGAEGGDPSAVVFDAVQRAAARGNDLVLADTAGRLHTKVNLVEELKKIRRVADRPPGVVTEVLLVLDATTGQNALAQARQFTDAVGVTGVVLTKLDGTAKGGVVVAIQRELGVPVKLVGLGEGPDDLVPFEPVDFVEALLG